MTLLPITAATLAAFLVSASGLAQQPSPDETQRTAAGAIATTQHWLDAEVHGDVSYIDDLLLPEYRSVDGGGIAHPKAAIVASTGRNRGSDAKAREVAAYLQAHPHGTRVTIQDNTAVVTYYAQALGADRGVQSTDILVYRAGRWHALYSQHVAAKASGAPR